MTRPRSNKPSSSARPLDEEELKGTSFIFGNFPAVSSDEDDDYTYDTSTRGHQSFDSMSGAPPHHAGRRNSRRSGSRDRRNERRSKHSGRRKRADRARAESFDTEDYDDDLTIEDDDSVGWNGRHYYRYEDENEDSSDSSDDEEEDYGGCGFFSNDDDGAADKDTKSNFLFMCLPDLFPEMRDSPPQEEEDEKMKRQSNSDGAEMRSTITPKDKDRILKVSTKTSQKRGEAEIVEARSDVEVTENDGKQTVVNTGNEMSFMHVVKSESNPQQGDFVKAPSSLGETTKTPPTPSKIRSRLRRKSTRSSRKEQERAEAEAAAAKAAASAAAAKVERREVRRLTRITITSQ